MDAPVTEGLRRLLDGELAPGDWLESVRSGRRPQERRAA